ncbi:MULTISPECIES: DUF6197 family protein [Streptomyces]|uniref:DUF6197 family protein n=1 Tax=Streptomyces TaxID=1883 RepID=UPI000F54F7B5|nr:MULTISPECIES: hypothetical protein [Streptomyces]RPK70658.1 hypothetical protein EES45_35415 [Streptomyces sp. ADI97-07]WRY79932.1 hypothetical protein OG388_01095 [Streptomyces clavifer]WRY86385.1 hypothetical protein OG388_36895 [Streptomyces clavifer]WUC32439.1 hypothetical protein OG927_34335 [Streptomyces clavifer]
MPHTTPTPAIDHPTPNTQTAASPTPPAELTLEERLTLVNTLMTVRLDEAAVAYEVNTAHIETEPVDLANVPTVPLTPILQPPPQWSPTPVAAVLQRAHQRLLTGGWCSGALVDEDGAHCMLGAIRIEAHGNKGLEADAAAVLLDTIRRRFGDVESVPAFNDSHGGGRIPMRMLDHATGVAANRGL